MARVESLGLFFLHVYSCGLNSPLQKDRVESLGLYSDFCTVAVSTFSFNGQGRVPGAFLRLV